MAEPWRFTLNGTEVSVEADPKTSSLEVLRESLGVFTCKAGCSPQGLCGCCTALIDGKPRLTCTLPVKSLAGKSVTTLEGVPSEDRLLLADAFLATGGTQCGYCTPGIALSAHALISGNTSPSREEIVRALNQHLCRCTGYTAIISAIERAAEAKRNGTPLPPPTRPEGREIVLGERPYVDDLVRPGVLQGAIVFAPVAYGVVRSIDIEAAQAMDGVAAVLILRPPGEALWHAGDPVVAIAATDAVIAARAALAIKIEIEPTEPPNIEVIATGRRRDGDVDAALSSAAARVQERYTTAATDPVQLEPEAALSVPLGEGLVIYSAAHDGAAVTRAVQARVSGPVRTVLVPSGGSYGGKVDPSIEPIAAMLSKQTGKPVRLAVSMEQGMRLHPRRPGSTVTVDAGLDADGKLTALRAVVDIDGGASCPHADSLVAGVLGALAYDVPNLDLHIRVLRTTSPPTGPVRGGAAIALCFAVEQALNQLATATNRDAFALRLLSAALPARLLLLQLRPQWSPARGGVALARADGAAGAKVVLTVSSLTEIEVQCNVPELGQGRDATLLATLTAATGLPAEHFVFPWADAAVVGAAAPMQARVERAAQAAAKAIVEGGLQLGHSYTGDDHAAAAEAWSAQVVVLDDAGGIAAIHARVSAGLNQDPVLVTNLAEGALHMGCGVGLSEEIEIKDGLPETRLRMLGILKPKNTPSFFVEPYVLPGGPRDVSEVALLPTAAAIAGALHSSKHHTHLPMKDSPAAKAAGVRVARTAGQSG